jgi:predicted amidohydrolase YtcJ
MPLIVAAASCAHGQASSAPSAAADAIYAGGDILTMAGPEPRYAEALAVKNGRIVFVGAKADAAKLTGAGTRRIDLGGRTLLPGFVDAHGHILGYADTFEQGNLNPPPMGQVRTIADLVAEMKALKARLKADDTAWLFGNGYDPDLLAEGRHPTAQDLDAAFRSNPVVVGHASGHMVVANTAALRAAGITAATEDPKGGTIIRRNGTREPEGLVQEMAMAPFFPFMLAARPMAKAMVLLRRAQEDFVRAGITTASEGAALKSQLPVLEHAANTGRLQLDVVVLPLAFSPDDAAGVATLPWGIYRNRLKFGGLKIVVDGSPQGKTAYLTKPYLTAVPGCEKACRGFSSISQEQVDALVLLAYRHGVQLYAHCNGDAAIDMLIVGHHQAERQLSEVRSYRRTVVVHSQVMRSEQLDAYRRYGLLPSFFTNHTFYWGDVHVGNLGRERAFFTSPLRSAAARGIVATNHADTPVTPPDPLFVLWSSVNRVSRSGAVIGESERVTPYEGLVALTRGGAYQFFEEGSKGTLEPGKLADLVVLDRNPLKVEPMAIKEVRVVETIKEGRTLFRTP